MSRAAGRLPTAHGAESPGGPPIPNRWIAWALLFGLGMVTLLLFVLGEAGLLKYGFPAAALIVGGILFLRHQAAYVGFVWWLWFITPLIRRLIDYETGYDPLNPVMIAPLAVTALCLLSVLRHLPKLQRMSLLGFFPILVGILLAYPIGAGNNGLVAATYGLLDWAVPIAFGFHLATDDARYLEYRRVTSNAFLWGTAVLGLYGVWQFLGPLPWDGYWMVNTDMSTIGRPFPFEVRVFSTLNSPTPFAMVMLAGLLILLETRALVHFGAGLPAYLSLLLSSVRTAWCGWILGVGLYAIYLRPPVRQRVFALLGVFALALALLTVTPLGSKLERRFESFTSLEEDKSVAVRLQEAVFVGQLVMNEPVGRGLGVLGTVGRRLATSQAMSFDNGFLAIFYTLGWAGGLLYLGGTVFLLVRLMRPFEVGTDPVPRVARTVAFATFAALASLNTLTGVSGVTCWAWMGLSLGASAWYRRTAVQHHTGQLHASALASLRATGARVA